MPHDKLPGPAPPFSIPSTDRRRSEQPTHPAPPQTESVTQRSRSFSGARSRDRLHLESRPCRPPGYSQPLSRWFSKGPENSPRPHRLPGHPAARLRKPRLPCLAPSEIPALKLVLGELAGKTGGCMSFSDSIAFLRWIEQNVLMVGILAQGSGPDLQGGKETPRIAVYPPNDSVFRWCLRLPPPRNSLPPKRSGR